MKRILALIMAAIVLATVTGVTSYYYLQNAESHVMAGLETVTVLETKQVVPAGTKFSDAMAQGLVGPVNVPSKFSSANMLTPKSAVAGNSVAGRDMAVGRLLFSGDFVTEVETNKLLPVPDGDVAVSFTLAGPNRLAPFLSPGDHVAVIDGHPGGGTAAAPAAPAVVFNDVLVLGVGASTSMGTGNASDPASATLVTVAVPLGSSPDLVKAINGGGIYLAMRGAKAVA